MQIIKPVGIGVLCIIMGVGIIALVTEFTEFEEIAKVVVIPSLVLLILVTGYALFQTFRHGRLW